MKIVLLGLVSQIVFILFISVFGFIRLSMYHHFGVYSVALPELFLGVISFLCGVYGLFKKVNYKLSLPVTIFGFLICLWFIVLYLLPEAGIPPAIPWFYSE
ncbi:hypothetical protein CR205_11470 [Alteribacter lacisalsi]|uniref:Uncharacterized protein n=1 Tax=Alteribacter lacisalsi TaxID=2045244 RepID=A0A2W0HHD0_9BACI|nr:hypothetical protein [Alteribacter lacisalsi]PYZ96342.1 hypothetical protein CR205_11470 [Alteribacter lacisalsi]